MLRFTDNAIVQLTLGCNCNCKYCYEGEAVKKHPKYIDYETFKKVVDSFIYQRCILGSLERTVNIHLHGGELFTLPFEEIKKDIAYIEERKKFFPGVTYCLQTNGTLINDEIAEFFAEKGFTIGFSWDGYSVADRGFSEQQNYELIEKLRSFYLKYGTKFSCLSVFSKNNMKTWYKDMLSLRDFVSFFGVNPICTLPQFDNLIPSSEEQWEYWYKPVLESYLTEDAFRERALDLAIQGLITENFCKVNPTETRRTGCFDRICGFETNMTAIDPDLNCYSCDKFLHEADYFYLRKPHRLLEPDFLGLQQAKRAFTHYKNMFALEKEMGCYRCPCQHVCAGECQSSNISKIGQPKLKDTPCDAYIKIYEFVREHWLEMITYNEIQGEVPLVDFTPEAKYQAKKQGYNIYIDLENNILKAKKGELI